jgi:hypothetical protein
MDLSAQIKDSLISRIRASKDLNFLKAVQTIFDSSEETLYQLSKEQEDAIVKGRNQIATGQFKPNGQVIFELREWLSKK